MNKIGIGLYGDNGHQIQQKLSHHPRGRLVATAAMSLNDMPEQLLADESIRHYDTLDELLADERVQFVSLCSPRRRDQAEEVIRCLHAGRDAYAEKPCAMTEADLDAIEAAVASTGRRFREMANGISDEQPFLALRRTVEAGVIGTVVQVLTQKSYPYHDERPQDEDIDGGLIGQCAGYNLRFIEQVAGVKIESIQAVETQLGNPREGGLQMAVSMMMRLVNGGVASAVANYLNHESFGTWGNEAVRIFGTKGFVETVDGATKTRLVLHEKDCGELDLSEPSRDYLDTYLQAIASGGDMPRSLADELHATRMTIRAKLSATKSGDVPK